MSWVKKARDNQDKKVLMETFGKKPKHRCPICHRFSLWVPKKNKHNIPLKNGQTECVMCELIKRTKEEEDGKRKNSQPKNKGKQQDS